MLSILSKSYISQVKNGKRKPSQKLIDFLEEFRRRSQTKHDYLALFLQSREAMEVTLATMSFYRTKLARFFREINPDTATKQDIEAFLIQFKTPGNRHAYHRVIKTFYNWREENFDIPTPVKKLKAPRLGKPILPTLTAEQVAVLIDAVESNRDKAIIAMFTESGLRLNELVNVKSGDIDWANGTVQVLGKGRKEALAPLGKMTQHYLTIWLQEHPPEELYGDSINGA
ncbi:MAG: tyrosine-type recombinase/integrase [Planctomycetes bacterium]|nr:tyrosine-type recombinase/integrase [Planctomycetota bacterium]